MPTVTPEEPEPQPSIGFRWSELFPDSHPERRRSPRERSLFFTTTTVLVIVAWIAAFVGPFASISGRWASDDPKGSVLLLVSMSVPPVVGIASVVYGIVRFRKAQLAWPVPLIGAGIIALNLVLVFLLAAIR